MKSESRFRNSDARQPPGIAAPWNVPPALGVSRFLSSRLSGCERRWLFGLRARWSVVRSVGSRPACLSGRRAENSSLAFAALQRGAAAVTADGRWTPNGVGNSSG